MRMARVNVYLPDDLAEAAKKSGLNVSALTQEAIRNEIEGASVDRSRKSGIDTDACGSAIRGYVFQMNTRRLSSGYGKGRMTN